MEKYKCINFDTCSNWVEYKSRGRKPKRCRSCQLEYSKKLRRNAYRKKVKDKVKIAKCSYRLSNGGICGMPIPYVTNKPQHCPKHARQARLDWMRRYYTGDKIVRCEVCNSPIRYETKKPVLCTLCKARERLQKKRVENGTAISKDTQGSPQEKESSKEKIISKPQEQQAKKETGSEAEESSSSINGV